MELVGERYRPGLGTGLQVAFSLGYMLQPVIAYKLRDEFWYQVAATSPNLVFPFIVMYVQVTSLWLLFALIYNMLAFCCMRFVVIRELFCPWRSLLNVLLGLYKLDLLLKYWNEHWFEIRHFSWLFWWMTILLWFRLLSLVGYLYWPVSDRMCDKQESFYIGSLTVL